MPTNSYPERERLIRFRVVIHEKKGLTHSMKDKILGVLERILWGMAGAIVVLVMFQNQWSSLMKIGLSVLCIACMTVYSIVTNMSGKGSIDSYQRVTTARKDMVPKPMTNEDARIVRENSKSIPNQQDKGTDTKGEEGNQEGKRRVKSIVLINEEGTALTEWSLTGKSGMVIGKSTPKEPVDIDLSCSAFAQMISKQHAVLNYTDNGWCIDDIDSKNGTRVKKINRNAILDLKLMGTVELGVGDIIYIANTMLQLR